MTDRDKYLTRLVENALGIQSEDFQEEGYGDGNAKFKAEKRGLPPVQGPQYSEAANEEMVEKEPLPKYENIEKLMQEIEEGTNKAMYEYKIKRMEEIADMLKEKVSYLEEGEHAEYTDKKAISQLYKDIKKLQDGAAKLRKEFDKKFNKKGKAAAPKVETETEKPTLQENKNTMKNFDLKKFLTENKLTSNSRMLLKENSDMDEKMQFFMDFMEQYEAGMPEADILEILQDSYDIPEDVNMQILEKATSELDLVINDIYTAIFESENLFEKAGKGVLTQANNISKKAGMTEIIVIVGGGQGGIDDVSTVTTPLSFEKYCQKKGVTDFNESRTMASSDIDEETSIAYVDANNIDPQIKAVILDDNSDSNDVYAALETI